MIFEKGKDGVNVIYRTVRDHGVESYECQLVSIPSYQSIDLDKYGSEITIAINSNIIYKVSYTHGTAKDKFTQLIKSEIRDGKINEVLSAK